MSCRQVGAGVRASPLIDAYRNHPGRARIDELVDADGVRPHARRLAATVESLGLGGLLAARAEATNEAAAEGMSAAGLPARHVSGYLETAPRRAGRSCGADVTHAWASVLTPTGAWVDLDPTNDHFADNRYIVIAWGRDLSDVSWLRGVVLTEAGSSDLVVEVDVQPLD